MITWLSTPTTSLSTDSAGLQLVPYSHTLHGAREGLAHHLQLAIPIADLDHSRRERRPFPASHKRHEVGLSGDLNDPNPSLIVYASTQECTETIDLLQGIEDVHIAAVTGPHHEVVVVLTE